MIGIEQDRLSARDIAVLCAVALVANLFFAGQTSLLIAYQSVLHFSLTESGWLATIEGGAYAFGMLLAALSAALVRPNRLKVCGLLLLLALAQALSAGATTLLTMGLCRSVSGMMAGLILSVGTAAISSTGNAGRAFALYFGALFLSGVVALPLITYLLLLVGLPGTYLMYAALILGSMAALGWYPVHAIEKTRNVAAPVFHQPRARSGRVLMFAALFVNFVFNGGIWVLAEQLGLEIPGINQVWLSDFLAGSMLFGLIGTAVATAIAPRRLHLFSLVLGNALLIVSMLMLSGWRSASGFVLAMALLNISVTF